MVIIDRPCCLVRAELTSPASGGWPFGESALNLVGLEKWRASNRDSRFGTGGFVADREGKFLLAACGIVSKMSNNCSPG